jgi:hypothetical protein
VWSDPDDEKRHAVGVRAAQRIKDGVFTQSAKGGRVDDSGDRVELAKLAKTQGIDIGGFALYRRQAQPKACCSQSDLLEQSVVWTMLNEYHVARVAIWGRLDVGLCFHITSLRRLRLW